MRRSVAADGAEGHHRPESRPSSPELSGPEAPRAPDAPGAPGREVEPEAQAIEAEVIPEELQQAIRTMMKMESYASPHPHPEHLERYVALYPDAARIVFDSYEAQGVHRREMERQFMTGSERRANIGQWLAFLLVGGAIAGGIVALLNGLEWAGGTVLVAALGGGVILAITGSKQQSAPAAAGRSPRASSRRASSELEPKQKPTAPPDPE